MSRGSNPGTQVIYPGQPGDPANTQPGAGASGNTYYPSSSSHQNPNQFVMDPNTGAVSPLRTTVPGSTNFSKPKVRRGTLQAVAAHPADNLPDDVRVTVDLENVPAETKVELKLDHKLTFLFFPGFRDLADDTKFGISLTELFGEDNVYFSTPLDDSSSVGADDSASVVATQQPETQQSEQGGQMVMTHRGPVWVPPMNVPYPQAQAVPTPGKGPDPWQMSVDPWADAYASKAASWKGSAAAYHVNAAQQAAQAASEKGENLWGHYMECQSQ